MVTNLLKHLFEQKYSKNINIVKNKIINNCFLKKYLIYFKMYFLISEM